MGPQGEEGKDGGLKHRGELVRLFACQSCRTQASKVKWPRSQQLKAGSLYANDCVCVHTQSCPALCKVIDYSPPGFSVHESSKQEYWSRLPFPTPGDLPDPGNKTMSLASPALAVLLRHQGRSILVMGVNKYREMGVHSEDCVCGQSLSHVQLFAIPWTVTCQAPLSVEFSRQGYWSGLPFPSPSEDYKVLCLILLIELLFFYFLFYMYFLLKYSCFTISCQFQVYSTVTQLCVCVCVCVCVCMYIYVVYIPIYIQLYIPFQILFPYRLLEIIDYISLCCTVGPHWLSILYMVAVSNTS